MQIIRDFKCTRCGLCCQHISHVLPEFDTDGTGVCCHYDPETKLCRIYESRPLICRVKETWQQGYTGMGWNEWCELNYAACKKLQKYNNDNTTTTRI